MGEKIILEGVAKNVDEPERAYRGYVAIDDLQFAPMGEGTEQDACHGHCTFEGGTCGWTNQEEGDDFDWTLARGSDNFFTGPARDYWSFSKEYPLGGFIYIDASYPRRPGDRSLLVSPKFEATGENEAICFKFATHMYGNGVGSLRVWYRPQDTASGQEEVVNEKILWEMSGESGNHWNLAQLPIASSSAFQIVFEGIVGSNYLGNIAIDSVSIEQGSCPISPQTASRDSGDCTFEENMCYWTSPLTDAHLDDFDWIRQFSYGNFLPKRDNSRKTSYGYFMSLNGDHLQQRRGGTYAWLLSGEFPPQGSFAKCMSFYYFMYQRIIHTGGPSLGGLRVYIRTTDQNGNVILLPVWRLNNHQSMKWRKARLPLVGLPSHQANGDVGHQRKPPGNPYQVVIEGIWGDARVGSIAIDDISFVDGDCSTTPPNAQAVYGECSFDRNLCGWRNHSKLAIKPQNQLSSSLGPPNKFTSVLSPTGRSQPPSGPLGHRLNPVVESSTWRLATPASRPTNMHDHTFRAPVGYVFFEVFNQNSAQTPVLQSRKFPAKDGDVSSKCLSFWFAAIGRSDSTQLSIYQLNEGEGAQSDADIGEAAPKDTSAGAPETGNRIQLWSIQTRKLDTRRPQWYYGQVTINAETAHQRKSILVWHSESFPLTMVRYVFFFVLVYLSGQVRSKLLSVEDMDTFDNLTSVEQLALFEDISDDMVDNVHAMVLPRLELAQSDFFSLTERVNALRSVFETVLSLERDLLWNPIVPSRMSRGFFLVKLLSNVLRIMPFREDIIDYVRINSRLGPDDMCGSFLGSTCASRMSEKLNWTLELPEQFRVDSQYSDEPVASEETGSANGSKVFKIAQITDIHFDPYFSPGTRTDCGEPVCCRTVNGPARTLAAMARIWGDYTDCDTPFFTVDSAVKTLATEHGDTDYWMMTGDLPPHDVWEYNKNETLAHIRFMTWMVKENAGGTKVYPVIGNQLRWLIEELHVAEKDGDKVHIIGHVPPDHRECTESWLYNYIRIVERFTDTITAQFFGHTHRDEFRTIYSVKDPKKPVGFEFICPSVTSYSQTNPAYRIYHVDSHDFTIRDYETYYFNLTDTNDNDLMPSWKLEYTARQTYGVNSFNTDAFHNILQLLETNDHHFEQYYRRYYVQSEVDVAKIWDLTRRELILKDHKVQNPFETEPTNLIPVV
ncbi:MAM and LDL-receptor class A domain-containing protein 1 [Halotydeus destructor]|nr:MAM and LDL-receptor class A domain-containing protein 1 [Halotydeus destructor]